MILTKEIGIESEICVKVDYQQPFRDKLSPFLWLSPPRIWVFVKVSKPSPFATSSEYQRNRLFAHSKANLCLKETGCLNIARFLI